jgi:CRP-like cAMP-binding protein
VLGSGKRRVLYRGAQLFSQGSPQDGIFLIESGRIKVFYTAPSGREITLAYWHSDNFVGGPEVFKQGLHVWSGVAAVNSTVLHLPGDVLRRMVMTIPALAIGIIEGLSFKGQCYSALAQMLGTRSPTERLAQLLLHLMNLYGVEERDGVFDKKAPENRSLSIPSTCVKPVSHEPQGLPCVVGVLPVSPLNGSRVCLARRLWSSHIFCDSATEVS